VTVVLVALLLVTGPGARPTPSGPPTGSGGLATAPTTTARPSTPAGPSTAAATASPTAAPTATPSQAAAAPTAPPRTTADPRLAYAEFLLRIEDDRSQVERLNRDLSTAAQAQDPVAVRKASVAILDFADGERDWLRDHPPAECYAPAHASANAMLDAYGLAADRFIRWADTGGGLAGLAALGDAVDAAERAGDALTAFGATLEATSCAR
jgi:hypothetical protein